ncbi:MAG: uracil-DNA glycosylase, partial [Actinomycetota bacterium]|nr:uracil-DNA glycosylase [Actinomycetota bacterium]
AKVMLVGEQPGDVEDQDREPFVGPAGCLLHRAMDEAGIAEPDAYLTSAVKHFRFVQRRKRRIHEKPDLAHPVACKPWLNAEVAEVDPTVDRRARATAARSILGPGIKVTKRRGES